MPLSRQFAEEVLSLQKEVAVTNGAALARAGEMAAQSIAEGGMLHVFGSGHSAMVAMELVGRAGGLVPVNPIFDPAFGWAENLPGYGARLFEIYDGSYGVNAGETVVVVSNSGRNNSPMDVALAAIEKNARVIAVTSLTMSSELPPKHASGKRLYEVADVTLDNLGVSGDALIEAPGGGRTAPTSTLTGALLMQMFLLETLEALHRVGVSLPILRSQNVEGGAEHNEKLLRQYHVRLRKTL